MTDDAELLRCYVQDRSDSAFTELVTRQVNFVYACALRRVGGDAHLAKDVTQQVFVALARSAAELVERPVLTGWLYTTTRHVAAQVVRTERRRQSREQEVQTMNELTATPTHDAEWRQLRPVIDSALDDLRDDDREAVLLRFFENKSFAEVGARLQLTENTARMRVERALGRLHTGLVQRGVTSTTTALGLALTAHAAVTAPAGLAASAAGAALGGATAGSLIGAGKLAIAAVLAISAVGAFLVVQQARANAVLESEVRGLTAQRSEVDRLRADNRRLAGEINEAQALQSDDAELTRLRDEAAALARRIEQTTTTDTASPRMVNVAGQVRQPGKYTLPKPNSVVLRKGSDVFQRAAELMTLRAVIAQAGGVTPGANVSKIRVSRQPEDGGAPKVYVKDLRSEADASFMILPGDIIYVPEIVL